MRDPFLKSGFDSCFFKYRNFPIFLSYFTIYYHQNLIFITSNSLLSFQLSFSHSSLCTHNVKLSYLNCPLSLCLPHFSLVLRTFHNFNDKWRKISAFFHFSLSSLLRFFSTLETWFLRFLLLSPEYLSWLYFLMQDFLKSLIVIYLMLKSQIKTNY